MPVEPRKYSIVREIGKGGMGTVYEVSHRVFQRKRALKVLNADLAGRKDLLERFMKEAVRMSRLQHPHIVMVHDIEEDEGFGTYIVMDLIDGQSLRDMIKASGPLPYLDVLRIGAEIASALDVAHRENIIHRDIKAQNILIEKATGKAVLTDFGIAKEMHREGEETMDGTATGVFIGTVRYACPEMFRMGRPHPRWDVYAMGAVLYEALSGHIYLEELKQEQIPTNIGYDPNFQPRLLYPQPPPEDFELLVRDCLQRDADHRVDSAATLLQRLEQCKEVYLTVHKKRQTQEALRAAHGETERDLDKLRAVQHQLADLDISAGDGTRAEEIEDRLREIGELEEADRHAEALAQIEALRERVGRALQRNDHIARDQLQRAVDALAQRWSDLAERAGTWIQGDEPARIEALFTRLRQALEAGQWDAVVKDVGDAPSLIGRLELSARSAAEPAVRATLAALATSAAELERLDRAAVPRDFNLAALCEKVETSLREGQLDTAAQHAGTAQAIISAALDRARQRAGERAAAAREECDGAHGGLDLAAARRLAATELDEAEAAHQAARTAESSGDLAASADAYARAAQAYRAAAARVAERQDAERNAAADQLRAALAASAEEPAAVVGDARRAAEIALARLPAAHDEALTALRGRLDELVAVRAGVAAFADAEAKRAAADAAEQQAATLPQVDRAAQRAAARLSSEAKHLFEARQWSDAAARYADAAAAWQALETKERADALQHDAAAALDRVTQLAAHASALAVSVDAPAAAALRRELAAAADLARRGSREEAIRQLERVRDAAAAAETAHATALTAAMESGASAVATRWREMAERAGALATPQRSAEAERQVADIRAAVAGAAWDAGRRALTSATTWLERADGALRDDAARAIGAELASLQQAAEVLQRDGAAAPPAADAQAARARSEAALADGRLADAIATASTARAAADAALTEHRRRLAEQTAAARAALETLVAGIEIDAARAAAPQSIDEAMQARRAAEEAEQRGELRAATAAYERAAAAFRAAAEALEGARRRQVADAANALRTQLQQATDEPATLLAPARAAAEDALRATRGAASVAALQALQQAHDGLGRARADAARYREAEANKHAAEATVVRINALPLDTDEREAATVVMQEAGKAFERHAWDDARDGYAAAEARLASIADAVERRVEEERQRQAQLDAARDTLRAAADAARAQPDDVVGDALRAAEALLGAADPALDRLAAAQAALTAAAAEVPDYRGAAAQRDAARGAAEHAAQHQPSRRPLRRPARTLRQADAAFAKRQWQAAAAAYGAAVTEYAAAELVVPVKLPAWGIPAAIPVLGLVAFLAYRMLSGGGEPALKPVPPPPPPAPIAIAAADPAAPALTLAPGTAQRFSIELPSGRSTDDIEWTVAGEPVAAARGQTSWQYTPDPQAAGESYQVAVKVDGGRGERQTQTWKVSIERPEPPPPPPTVIVAALPSIAGAEPSAAAVSVDEGIAQPFSIQLADASGTNPDIEWLFDGKPVSDARGKSAWSYRPDYAAAGSYDVAVTVGDGVAPERRRVWTVNVNDVNRGIELSQVLPPTSQDIKKSVGQSVDFTVKAKDKDGDALTYAWSVDGKAAGGNRPSLAVPVTSAGTQTVALAITDGKLAQPESLKWRVTGVPAEFKPAVSPNVLSSLAFDKAQSFKLTPPPGVAASDLQVAWAVNGEKVSDALAFTFKADDPALIASNPVQISVTARSKQGDEFRKTWSPKIVPPAPKIAGASPPGSAIALNAGQTQAFSIDAPAPIGNQSFSYSFSVNGKPVASTPSFELTGEEGRDYTVVASIRDNYGQRAAERMWNVRVPSSINATHAGEGNHADGDYVGWRCGEMLVQAWLDTYRGALNSKNTPQICAVLGLSSAKCATLGKALAGQENLQVTFSDVQITPKGGDAACAAYTRQDEFVDPSGKSQSRSTSVNQCFRVVNGQVQLVKN